MYVDICNSTVHNNQKVETTHTANHKQTDKHGLLTQMEYYSVIKGMKSASCYDVDES